MLLQSYGKEKFGECINPNKASFQFVIAFKISTGSLKLKVTVAKQLNNTINYWNLGSTAFMYT